MFIDHDIVSKSILRSEWNIRIESWYELFIWSMLIDHEIHSKSILRSEQIIRIESC